MRIFHWIWFYDVIRKLCKRVARNLRCVTLGCWDWLWSWIMSWQVDQLCRRGNLSVWIPRILLGHLQILHHVVCVRTWLHRWSIGASHLVVFGRMRRLTLRHLAGTVREDDLLVLVEESGSMCSRRGVTAEIFIHQCRIPHWILERILCLKVTRKRIVEVLHVTHDIQRHVCSILLDIEKLLDLLI